nr:MAG: hypothetical protein [Bacteriophage sp.]
MDVQKAIEYFSSKLERTLSSRRREAYEAALEALERQNAKAVREIYGALGETAECPECGTGLYDEDVFAGYCKWCGQRIKREETNE